MLPSKPKSLLGMKLIAKLPTASAANEKSMPHSLKLQRARQRKREDECLFILENHEPLHTSIGRLVDQMAASESLLLKDVYPTVTSDGIATEDNFMSWEDIMKLSDANERNAQLAVFNMAHAKVEKAYQREKAELVKKLIKCRARDQLVVLRECVQQLAKHAFHSDKYKRYCVIEGKDLHQYPGFVALRNKVKQDS